MWWRATLRRQQQALLLLLLLRWRPRWCALAGCVMAVCAGTIVAVTTWVAAVCAADAAGAVTEGLKHRVRVQNGATFVSVVVAMVLWVLLLPPLCLNLLQQSQVSSILHII